MLFWCWDDAEDDGPTSKQHCVNVPCLLGKCCWFNAVLMLVRRRRRWFNINTTLGQCLVFAGTENNGVSHHTSYSSLVENRSMETVFTHTNVYDDTSENYSLSVHVASAQWTAGLKRSILGFEFPSTWNGVSRLRPTTSNGWKLLTFVELKQKNYANQANS